MFVLTIAWLGLALWRALAHYIREERLRQEWEELQARFMFYCMGTYSPLTCLGVLWYNITEVK